MSRGVKTSDDILLSKEPKQETTQRASRSPRFRITFWHLNSLAVMVVLSASGMVSVEDFAFVVFSIIYTYFLSRIAFPKVSGYVHHPPVFDKKNKILNLYAWITAVVGLFLPIAYVIDGVYEGDKEGIKAAAPHLFLLSSQVFMEGVSYNCGFSLPTFAFVPVFYNSRRIFTLVDWLRREIYEAELRDGSSARRLYFGRAVAVANMALWCFNLFGFLLPVYLPRVFKIYYSPHKA